MRISKILLATALVLGGAAAAQAGNDVDDTGTQGGFHTGPLGQHFGSPVPVYHYDQRATEQPGAKGTYATAPRYESDRD
jgi:hypothetical protein